MYEASFGLQNRPFLAAPLADRYFAASAIEASRQTLARCIERAEGAGMLVGPSGSGKSLLLQVLAEQFRSRFSVVLLSNTHLTTRRALLQVILFELGMPYRGMEEGELRLSLLDRLARADTPAEGLLLLVDEAHALPGRLMEEVRMITNVVRDGRPRARLVLAGAPVLEERLSSPKLASLNQRLTARCYLQSLNQGETAAYILAQLDAVGGSANSPFTDEALRAVHRATDGVPRLVNQLCDHAMMLAFAAGRTQIDGAGIDEAWADLQQLPMPWNERTAASQSIAGMPERADDVVEFGSLSSESEESKSSFASPSIRSDILPESIQIGGEKDVEEREEGFEPINIGVPEAELFFQYQSDPFAEHFADEEVIFDRYASAETTLSNRSRVYSAEGGALSAMLEPFLQTSSQAIDRGVIVPPPKSGHEQRSLSGTAESMLRIESSDEWYDETQVEPIAPQAHQTPPSADNDIIIIEDDPQTPAPSGVSTVRHKQYGHLFASLRRE